MRGLLVASLTFFSTSAGGLAAIRFRDQLHLLLGFSSGAVLGVVFFDVFPELIDRAAGARLPVGHLMVAVAAGFFSFFLLERLTSLHSGREHEHREPADHQPELGVAGAAGLSFHSFLDGIAIGIAFKTGTAIGILIGLAVLAHDFSDGLNTVTVVLAHDNPVKRAVRWLLIDASTPLLGAATALVVPIPEAALPWILAFFAGFFVYIGASDLLPEAREHDSPWVFVMALGGTATLFALTRVLSQIG